MKSAVLILLDFYTDTLSPFINFLSLSLFGIKHSCRYSPTCSEYTKQSIKEYGVLAGSIRGIKRLMSCHPFSRVK